MCFISEQLFKKCKRVIIKIRISKGFVAVGEVFANCNYVRKLSRSAVDKIVEKAYHDSHFQKMCNQNLISSFKDNSMT